MSSPGSTLSTLSLHERIQQLQTERSSTADYTAKLIALAKELAPSDPRYARILLGEACRIASDIKDPALIAETRMRLAWVRYLEGDLDAAITHAAYAKSVAERGDCSRVRSGASVVIAYIYRSLGDLDKAEQHIYEALAEARRSKDRAREADYLDELGSNFFAAGDYKRAYRAHQQARALYTEADPFLPHNANRLSRSALETGAIEDAESWAQQAINMCDVFDTQSQARFAHTLATVLLKRYPETPRLALETFERAQSILAKGVRNPEVEAEIYLDMGRALLACGQPARGIKHMEIGLAIAKKKNLLPLADRALGLLQSACAASGQKSQVSKYRHAQLEIQLERERKVKRHNASVLAALEVVARSLSRWRANFLDGAPAL
jgi:tetratricopeptide (TPR) repeat protein